jgi:hypothetical protein
MISTAWAWPSLNAGTPLDWPEAIDRVWRLLAPDGRLVGRPLFVSVLAAVVAEMAPEAWSELKKNEPAN